MRDRDPEGYYAALNVNPGASPEEIHLAYVYIKGAHAKGARGADVGKVRAAYDVLGNRRRRKEYDADPSATSRLNSVPLLLVLIVALAGVLGYVLAPVLMAPYVSFDVGDELYWTKTTRPLGVVVEYADEREFPDGAQQAAYRIQSRAGLDQWFPAKDLNRNCAARGQ